MITSEPAESNLSTRPRSHTMPSLQLLTWNFTLFLAYIIAINHACPSNKTSLHPRAVIAAQSIHTIVQNNILLDSATTEDDVGSDGNAFGEPESAERGKLGIGGTTETSKTETQASSITEQPNLTTTTSGGSVVMTPMNEGRGREGTKSNPTTIALPTWATTVPSTTWSDIHKTGPSESQITATSSAPSIEAKEWKIVGLAFICIAFVGALILGVIFFDSWWGFLRAVVCGEREGEGKEELVVDWEKSDWELPLAREDGHRYPNTAVTAESDDGKAILTRMRMRTAPVGPIGHSPLSAQLASFTGSPSREESMWKPTMSVIQAERFTS